jgi:cyclophilin family peptidyl-prolyl cis-trans isomerase
MDQSGDPNSKDAAKKDNPCTATDQTGWGCGGPPCSYAPQYPCSNGQYTIPDEFACHDGSTSSTWTGAGGDPCASHGGAAYHFDHAGVMAMANQGRPHSGGSQFFLTMAATSFLNGGYPIFGDVEGGVDVVKAIGATATDANDRPTTDVFILSVRPVG